MHSSEPFVENSETGHFDFFRWHCSCRCQDKWQMTASFKKSVRCIQGKIRPSRAQRGFFFRQYVSPFFVKMFKLKDLKDLSSESFAILLAIAFFWTCFTKPKYSQNFSIPSGVFGSQLIPAWQSYLAEIESDCTIQNENIILGAFETLISRYFEESLVYILTFVSWGHCWSFKSVPTIGSGRVSLPRAVAFFMPRSIRLWTVS